MELSENNLNHIITITERKQVSITGVKKIDSFDHKEFLLDTVMGFLHVMGNDLAIGTMNMDNGTLLIKGTIDSVSYVGKGKESKESFIKKLFK